MVMLQYVGTSHFRKISKADFVKAGLDSDLEGLGAISLASKNTDASLNPSNLSDSAEVPQEVADLLLRIEPKEWALTNVTDNSGAPANGVDAGLNPAVSDATGAGDAGTTETTAGTRSARTAR